MTNSLFDSKIIFIENDKVNEMQNNVMKRHCLKKIAFC